MLTKLEFIGRNKSGNGIFNYKCHCGVIKPNVESLVKYKNIQSCGCLVKETARKNFTTHGHCKNKVASREYHSWATMIQRCYYPKSNRYKRYGGRGISVCRQWLDSFPNFLSDMGYRPPKMSLDRIDNNGNYEPSNCRWATASQQQRNK